MKILHIIETPGTGGAERVLVDIATRLPGDFKSIGVAMQEGWTSAELRKCGIPVTVMPLQRAFDAGWARRFARFLRAEQVDVVQSHEFTANVYACVGARLAGIPIVCTTHGKNYWPFALYRRVAYRWVSRTAARFIAVSDDLGRFIASTLGIPQSRITIIRNGIDPDMFAPDAVVRRRVRLELGLRDEQPLLLACGELSEVKGHAVLLRALPNVLAARPGAMLAVAGDGPLRQQLEALAASLGITSSVRFLGFRRDVPDLLRAADVFVMPSLSEGLPLAILEAMAAEVPIVATEVGGIPELIRPGHTGWLVPAGDSAALGSALLHAASGAGAHHGVAAEAARLCRERYGLSGTVNAYAECYRNARKSVL